MDTRSTKVDDAKTLKALVKLRELSNLSELTLTGQPKDALYFYLRTSHEAKKAVCYEKTKFECDMLDQKDESQADNCNKISDEPKYSEEEPCSWHTEVRKGNKNGKYFLEKAKVGVLCQLIE